MDIKKIINLILSTKTYLILILFFFKIINPHGFAGTTLIQEASGSFWQIENIAEYVGEGQSLKILSYDELEREFIPKKIKAAGFCESGYRCRFFFNHDKVSLECTPLQLFYRVKDDSWVAAFKLKVGDRLLCSDNKTIEVASVELIHEKLKVYTLEIKGTHTFLVSRHKIVAHNMLLPCSTLAGLAIPLDVGCGASVGSVFGPVGICAGVIVGGVVGCIINSCIKDRVLQYGLSFKSKEVASFIESNKKEVRDKNYGAQAPGKPTENDGFFPKKNWDGKKVRHAKGFGWPDQKGSVWIPSGPNGHGCPHWDVQHPNGDYDNVVPGGRIRGQK